MKSLCTNLYYFYFCLNCFHFLHFLSYCLIGLSVQLFCLRGSVQHNFQFIMISHFLVFLVLSKYKEMSDSKAHIHKFAQLDKY